jgi:hypothetical protein
MYLSFTPQPNRKGTRAATVLRASEGGPHHLWRKMLTHKIYHEKEDLWFSEHIFIHFSRYYVIPSTKILLGV